MPRSFLLVRAPSFHYISVSYSPSNFTVFHLAYFTVSALVHAFKVRKEDILHYYTSSRSLICSSFHYLIMKRIETTV